MRNAIIISTLIHALLILPLVHKKITVPRNNPGAKPKTLIVSIQYDKTGKVIKGFPGKPGEQAETFLPDDSCAWSIEQQKEALEDDF